MTLRLALRSLRRSPGFTLFALLVFTLGIGLTTTAFFVLNAVLFRPLDLPSPEQLVQIRPRDQRTGRMSQNLPGLDFRDLSQNADAFQSMAAYYTGRDTILLGKGQAAQVRTAFVSQHWHDTIGRLPIRGRALFTNGLEETGALVSYGFWQSRLGGTADVLSRTLQINGKLYPICGVMPPDGVYPEKTEVWMPLWPDRDGSTRTAYNFKAIGRLKPDVSLAAGRASLSAVAASLERQYPKENAHRTYTAIDLREQLVGNYRAMLWTLSGAVFVVLLMACANVANLLLARAIARQRELAIRMALGAAMRNLFATVLAESLLLSILGGTFGLLLAIWLRDALVAQIPFPIPRLAQANVDLSVIGFALLASTLCGIMTGVIPAWRVWRADVQDVLAHTGSAKVTSGGDTVRSFLLVTEVAFSVVLLVGAGLLLKSFARLTAVDPGFRTDHLLVMETDLSALGRNAEARLRSFYDEMQQQAKSLPGVTGAAWNRDLAVQAPDVSGAVLFEGRPQPAPGDLDRYYANWHVTGPGYFAALGIPVSSGRDFQDSDDRSRPDVAVVNEAFVQRFFPDGQSPIGHRFQIGMDRIDPLTIVGVVKNVRPQAAPAGAELYLPYMQHLGSSGRLYLTARVHSGNTTAVVDTLRQMAVTRAPEAVLRFTSIQQAMDDSVSPNRFRTFALGWFAAIALALALIGLYGVISYVVQARTREIGLRMALGAQTADVLRQFLGKGMRLTAGGLVIGIAAAYLLRSAVAGFLFDTPASDVTTYLSAAGLLAACAALACLLPAWRASHADPAQVLRED